MRGTQFGYDGSALWAGVGVHVHLHAVVCRYVLLHAVTYRYTQAYEVLGDEDIRRRYDAGEDVDDPNARQQQQHNPFGGGGFPGGGFGGGGQRFHFQGGF